MRRCPGLAVLATLACAQYGAPPGGERDQTPPQVVETVPPPFAVVPGFEGPVIIRFDERLSERGAEQAVLVSPQTGDVEVERDGDVLRVEVEGGWRAAQVYRIVVLPEVRDLFGNQRSASGELVFSTGPQIPPTAVAGIVTDRITGEPPENPVVHAVRTDSSVYIAPAATDGFYALLNIPNGTYQLVGFTDANRNWRLDPVEPRSISRTVALANDTLTVDLAILPVDTTAAIVMGAVQDGNAIRVQLDNYVDRAGLDSAFARLFTLPDTTPLEMAAEVLTPTEHARRLPPDTTVAGDTAAVADSALVADTAVASVQPPRADTTRAVPLPTRELIVLPALPLSPGNYLVEISGIVNINGIAGGGGRAPVTIAPPPAPVDPAAPPADTTAAPPDTAAASPRGG